VFAGSSAGGAAESPAAFSQFTLAVEPPRSPSASGHPSMTRRWLGRRLRMRRLRLSTARRTMCLVQPLQLCRHLRKILLFGNPVWRPCGNDPRFTRRGPNASRRRELHRHCRLRTFPHADLAGGVRGHRKQYSSGYKPQQERILAALNPCRLRIGQPGEPLGVGDNLDWVPVPRSRALTVGALLDPAKAHNRVIANDAMTEGKASRVKRDQDRRAVRTALHRLGAVPGCSSCNICGVHSTG
jgi:hypothetical protein